MSDEQKVSEAEYKRLEKRVRELLISLKPQICDDYRASDNDDDNTPGMQVTIGASVNEDGSLSWSYQTGDNSYTGGAYGHPFWGVVSLYRRSNCSDLAKEAVDQIAEGII